MPLCSRPKKYNTNSSEDPLEEESSSEEFEDYLRRRDQFHSLHFAFTVFIAAFIFFILVREVIKENKSPCNYQLEIIKDICIDIAFLDHDNPEFSNIRKSCINKDEICLEVMLRDKSLYKEFEDSDCYEKLSIYSFMCPMKKHKCK